MVLPRFSPRTLARLQGFLMTLLGRSALNVYSASLFRTSVKGTSTQNVGEVMPSAQCPTSRLWTLIDPSRCGYDDPFSRRCGSSPFTVSIDMAI